MKTVLERPKKSAAALSEKRKSAKSAQPPKAKTPFDMTASGAPGWLSCSIWSSPPSYPSRQRCQRDVLSLEFQEALKIVSEYREAEALFAANDISVRQHKLEESVPVVAQPNGWILSGNPMRRLTFEERFALQKEVEGCDHDKYLAAEAKLRELRKTAADLAKTVLGRLVKSFDAELNAAAIEAENRLAEIGLPLKNGNDFELHRHADILCRHSWREVSKSALRNLNLENAVGTCQWLCTFEEGVPGVSWL
jgi:hypothetical protein